MKQRLGAPAAILAMIGTVGWVGGPVMARGAMTLPAVVLTVVASLVVGAVVYVWMQQLVEGAMSPFRELEQRLRTAAARRRDHIAYFRREAHRKVLPEGEPAHGLHDALAFLLRRIEERQVRQAAWIGALVHDVKTPVAAAANALSTVSSEVHTWTGQERELIGRVGIELRGLASHVQDLLDAVRLDREDVDLKRQDVDLAAVVDEVVSAQPKLDAVTVRSTGAGHAIGDPVLLRRAIENLVANAVRYARAGVIVEIFPGLIRVVDDGPGLPAPLEELAEPFRSEALDLGEMTVHGGAAGMGLFLARRVLELHDGKLVVERSDGEGTALLAYVGRAPAR